ncbi:TPA: hypothetical protein DCW38_04365 [candidate division WOR-3 bacterium]|jgi:methionyl-tRNA formyltransferase|uniref:methionyl-tRNA formyltransferase n=1 Tax=candidate division WOR-3 bacterium TaxID=2052148 RepID=A0A350HA30_UNCW3|nr:hypothetical protein [candidate division WOR-3 bacterium]
MLDYAFIGNDSTSLLFLLKVIDRKKPKFIITGADRIEGRGRRLTPSLLSDYSEKLSIPYLKTDAPNSEEFLKRLEAFERPDFFLVFSFGYYLKKAFLDYPKRMSVNIHPSLLPLYRGAAPLNRVIMNNEKKSGISFFKMTSRMDAGPIISSKEFILNENETSITLKERAVNEAAKIFLDFNWERDFILEYQNENLATTAEKIEKKELILNLSYDALKVKCAVNGLSEYGLRAILNGKRIKILRASVEDYISEKNSGLIEIKSKRIIMYCNKGSISLEAIQPEGKKEMDAESFINGYKIKNGDKICAEFLE